MLYCRIHFLKPWPNFGMLQQDICYIGKIYTWQMFQCSANKNLFNLFYDFVLFKYSYSKLWVILISSLRAIIFYNRCSHPSISCLIMITFLPTKNDTECQNMSAYKNMTLTKYNYYMLKCNMKRCFEWQLYN